MNIPKQIKGYIVQKQIGSGTFGDVYQATRPVIGGDVAIKVIKADYANQPDFIHRFESEAQIIAHLDNNHIVQLYDYWRDPDGAYLVMRWLRGGDLKTTLAQGPLDIETARLILEQIAIALDHAHRHGVIHRDLKPANILFDEDGNACLADFGIAKNLTQPGQNTAAETFLGTLGYSSPEQIRGDIVTPQTDVYSLGVILYEMLVGEHPFPNIKEIVEVIYKSLNDPVPLITTLDPQIQDEINDIIQKATAKDPKNRYTDALQLATDFREFVTDIGESTPESIVESLTPREQEILQMMIDNKTNREIASELFIALSTVKWNINNIYKKLHVRSRIQAIIKGRELNFAIHKPSDNGQVDYFSTYMAAIDLKNPYKGLEAFGLADEKEFYGRDKITAKLMKRLNEAHRYQHFLAILGPSGSGKSSLVRAGLIPAILRERPIEKAWYIADMIPSTRPLDKLEVSLMRVASNHADVIGEHLVRDEWGLVRVADLILPDDGETELLVVIDQFEEVFTLVEDETARTHFLNLLTTAITEVRSRVRIVVTLRADYFDRPLQYPQFGEILRERMETVLPLSAEELEAAITQPAGKLGVTFEPGLVSAIISEINYQPGALPLLQYALLELFDQRENRVITQAAYQAIGGTVGALANRADTTYEDLSADGQALARQIFLRMVTLGEGAEDTRRRVSHEELYGLTDNPDLLDDVLNAFADTRLLSLDHDPSTREPTVEVAHEAILREWELLRIWLNDSREDIKNQRQIAIATQAWKDNNHDKSYLLRGKYLEKFESWVTYTELSLTPLEQEYLETSLTERRRQEELEASRQAKEERLEKRATRRLQNLVAVFVMATVIAAGLAIFAFDEQAKANEQSRISQREAEVSHSIALAASAQEALNDNDTDLAIALALEANNIDNPPPQAQRALLEAGYAPGTRYVLNAHKDSVNAVAFSGDGRMAISGGGHPLSLEENGTILHGVVEDTIRDFSVYIWDLDTGEIIHHLEGHTGTVWAVDFSSSGEIAVSGDDVGDVIFWDVETGAELTRFENRGAGYDDIRSLEFIENGRYLLIGAKEKFVILWDMATMTEIKRFESDSHPIEYDPLNQRLITIDSGDMTIDVFDINAEENFPDPLFTQLYQNGIWGISADMRHQDNIYIGLNTLIPELYHRADSLNFTTAFREIRTWNPEEQTEAIVTSMFGINQGGILEISYADGIIFTVEQDQVILRDLLTGQEVYALRGHTDTITDIDISTDGSQLVTASEDGTMRVWDLRNGAERRRIYTETTGTAQNSVSTDGQLIALAGANKIIEIWDLTTNQLKHRLRGHDGTIRGVYFVEDNQSLISISLDRSIRKWDVATGQELISVFPSSAAWYATLSGDRQYLFVFVGQGQNWNTATTNNVIVYDVETLTKLRTYPSRWGPMVRNDSQVAVALLPNGEAFVWDITTGEHLVRLEDSRGIGQNGIKFLPDGQFIIGSLDEEALALWNTETGQIVRRFVGNSEAVTGLEISPDGSTAVTYSINGMVILWDVDTGQQIGRLEGEFKGGYLSTLSADGESVFIINREGMLTEWDINLEHTEILDWVHENRYIRDLTCFERNFYNIEPLCDAPPVPPVGSSPTLAPQAPIIWTDTPQPTPIPNQEEIEPEIKGYLQHQESNNGIIRGGRSTPYSIDVWLIDGEAGQSLTVSLSHFGLKYQVVDPNGNIIAETTGNRIDVPALEKSGEYQIQVTGDLTMGGYAITATLE